MQKGKLQDSINLNSYMLDPTSLNLVLPGDLITSESGFMNGHGTYQLAGSIYSSVLGSVQKTNKLITVNGLRNRYNPQIGDVVVGRVVEILNKRWRVDIGSATHAFLHLNSTYIPTQRKKNQQDELNMRQLIAQNDLIVAEIHSLNNDKTVNLHTRNTKYGKLEQGALISVDAKLIRRQKHHLLQSGNISVILSNNGNIYLSTRPRHNQSQITISSTSSKNDYNVNQLTQISLISSILKLLNRQRLEISEQLIKSIKSYCQQKTISSQQVLYRGALDNFLQEYIRLQLPKRLQQLSKHIAFE